MYMTSVAGSPCAKTVSFPPNLETFLPRPVESRKNFTSNTGVLECAFLEERETGAETRRVAEDAMRHNTTQLKFADCPILYSMCRFAVPLFSVERQQAPYNSWYYSGFLAVAQYFPQRLVDFHSAAIVVDESLLPESVHKQIDSRARGPDHLRQHFVTEAGNLRTFSAVLVQVRQPQQHPRQPFFRRGSQQVRHVIPVLLDAGQQVRHQGI